jgi:prophage antirepressor-like protein
MDPNTINVNGKNIKIVGTSKNPWIDGKELCVALGYKDVQKTLFNNVKPKHKTMLADIKRLKDFVTDPKSEQGSSSCTFFWPFGDISYNEGKAVYVSEQGAYDLINACRLPLKHEVKQCFDAFFYDLRYKHGLMDLFTFIKDKKLAIDIKSDWFQELWYPLSKKHHVLGSMVLLEWMGYEGENYLKQQRFKKLLDNNNIPYEEISHDDERFIENPGYANYSKQQ